MTEPSADQRISECGKAMAMAAVPGPETAPELSV